MQTVSHSFILIGLDNGMIAGWNLNNNGLDYMEVSSQPISSLQKYPN